MQLLVRYGCKIWSLTLREEFRARISENRILGRVFGSKRDDNGERRRLHNEEIHNLYHSSYTITRAVKARRLSWTGGNTFKMLT
jgi:hypothetical protein